MSNSVEVCEQITAKLGIKSLDGLARAVVDYKHETDAGSTSKAKAASAAVTSNLTKLAEEVAALAATATEPTARAKFDAVVSSIRASSAEKLSGSANQRVQDAYGSELSAWRYHLASIC